MSLAEVEGSFTVNLIDEISKYVLALRKIFPHLEIISTFPEIFPYISDLSSKTFNTCTAARKAICWLGNNAEQKMPHAASVIP